MVNIHILYKPRRTTMPPRRKTWESFLSSAVEADTSPHSCADFRRKWTPTEFCNLPLSERTVILQGMLTNSDSIFIEQVDGGFNFATENTPIHEAMPLLYDQKTNGQIAREACEAFYQVGTVSPTQVYQTTALLRLELAEQHVHPILPLASPHTQRSKRYLDTA